MGNWDWGRALVTDGDDGGLSQAHGKECECDDQVSCVWPTMGSQVIKRRF